MIKLLCVIYQWIRLNELYKLYWKLFSNFEFLAGNQKISKEYRGVNIDQISMCYSRNTPWLLLFLWIMMMLRRIINYYNLGQFSSEFNETCFKLKNKALSFFSWNYFPIFTPFFWKNLILVRLWTWKISAFIP